MSLFLVSVISALLISATCSLVEASLLSLSPSKIGLISQTRPRIGAIWRDFNTNIERPIAAILILNTAAHTVGASVAGAEFNRIFGDEWIWMFSIVFTFLMLQFTEILAKGVGVRYNDRVAIYAAHPLTALIQVMQPVVMLVHGVNRLFGWRRSVTEPPATMEEITALAGLARISREISRDQERIIKRGVGLSGIRVREIMRPRIEIDALEVDMSPDEVLGAAAMAGFARLPVYEGDLDHIIGFIYNKDLLRHVHMQWPLELRKLLHPPMLVPETIELDRLLERFREEHTQMAIVLDEHGGTAGLVTIEDILEEFVGAIHDEYRGPQQEIVQRRDGSWLIDGTVHLRDLCDAVGLSEPREPAPQQVNTVGGLVQALLDDIPRTGDQVRWSDLSLQVAEMDGHRIQRVMVGRQNVNP